MRVPRLGILFAVVSLAAVSGTDSAARAQAAPNCLRFVQPGLGGASPDCGSSSQVQVTIGTSPAGATFSVDGTSYTSTQSFTWTVGDTHTLAVSSPQTTSSGTEYSFSSWSDGGAASHTVTASSSTSSYTASFGTSYLLTIATNNSHGTVTPASGSYYSSGSTVSLKATPASGYSFNDWTGSSDIASIDSASTTITMKSAESITANFKSSSGGIQYFGGTANFVVTTISDNDTGDPINCPVGGPTATAGANCSLRDALAAAAQNPAANISFSSSVFAVSNPVAQNTITLENGALFVPANTTIDGLVTPGTTAQPNTITVNGSSQYSVFWIGAGESGVVLQHLNITAGWNTFGGGGIYNDGKLAVNDCNISGNSAPGGEGGGIYNDADGALTLQDSTVAGNSAASGGGILSYGTLTVFSSTISGNQATVRGAGIDLEGNGTIASSTLSANQAGSGGSGGGIAIATDRRLTLTNSIISGNSSPYSYADVEGVYTDGGGNVVGASNINLAPLGDYIGATETQIPLPGSPAICAALAANIARAVGADQRGLPDLNTTYPGYSSTTPCVDAGAVQTNYALAFTGQPAPAAPATEILMNTAFTAAVTLNESGQPFVPPVTLPLTLTGTGSLSGGSVMTASGVANYPELQVSETGKGDVLMASLALNPAITPTAPLLATASNGFDVDSLPTTIQAANVTVPFSGNPQSVPLTAAVASSQTVNAGTVTFTLVSGGNPIGAPTTSAVLTNGEAAVNYTLPAAVAAGTYTISAVYNAGGAFTASSDATHTLTIGQAASTTTISSSAANANLNASLTLTATVTGTATVTPTGTVTFYDGTAMLGTQALNAQGVAVYVTTGLAAGVHMMTAVYSGDADFAGSISAQYVQTVTAPDYSLSASPASLSLTPGQTGQVTFTFAPVGGFKGSVTFACTGIPAKATCSFTPTSLTADGSNKTQTTQMTIATEGSGSGTVSSNVRPGPGIAPRAASQPMSARLWLFPALAFGLLFTWQRWGLRQGGWLVLLLLALAVCGISACGSSRPSTAPGTYTLEVTASAGAGSGGATHTVVFTLTINE
jgi:hypothetical protein